MKPFVYLRWSDSATGDQVDRTQAARMIRLYRRNWRYRVTYDRQHHATRVQALGAGIAAIICQL